MIPIFHYFIQLYEWDANRYTFAGLLKGHEGPVNAFAFSQNGAILASGGDDERVRIWDLIKLRQCQALVDLHGRWGQITCLKFIDLEANSAAEWLCFGTGRGAVVLYRKARRAAEFIETHVLHIFSKGDSVETFAFDPVHQRLAVSSHYGQIKMLRYQNGRFAEAWGDKIRDAIPRALLFGDNGRSLTIYTLETGTVICRDVDTSTVLTTKILKTSIGHVSQCRSTGNLLVDNMSSGFDLYSPNRQAPNRTFRVEVSKMYIRSGAFAEGGRVVVCGSDHGRVYVFGAGDTQSSQQLLHGNRRDMIQSLEKITTNGFHYIVSSASAGNFDIYVWRKPIQGMAHRERRQLVEILVTTNLLFFIIFVWLTREVSSDYLKARFGDLAAAWSSAPSAHESLPKATVPTISTEYAQINPIVHKILYEMDDDVVRRFFKMAPDTPDEFSSDVDQLRSFDTSQIDDNPVSES